MTCEELQTILEQWRDETVGDQENAGNLRDELYEYNEGKIAAFEMLLELLKRKEK